MNISEEDRKKVKSEGFLSNNDKEHFSMRVITGNGVLNYKQLKNLSEVAEKFGNGKISFTTRLTVEIPGIKYEDIEKAKEYIAKDNMVSGGTGAKIRPVVACKGTVCVFGIVDTQAIALKIHERFFNGYSNVILPHKFKIAVGGCPNNCVKPDLNDFGMVGQRVPKLNKDLCKGCKKCIVESSCPMKAAKVNNSLLEIDKDLCSNCGICQNKCYFKSFDKTENLFRIYIGGRWGKTTRIGSKLNGLFTEEEALNILEKCILFFKEKGLPKERFAMTIDRIGIDNVEAEILSNSILERKNQIINDTNL